MILERQPLRSNLIETTFFKCEAEVVKKKIEATKLIKRSLCKMPKHKGKVSSNGVVTFPQQEQLCIDRLFPINSYDNKWPPDPPWVTKSSKDQIDDVSVGEHPLAIRKYSNSQLMSASTRTYSRVQIHGNERALKLTPKRISRVKDSKDPAAVKWEPPALE